MSEHRVKLHSKSKRSRLSCFWQHWTLLHGTATPLPPEGTALLTQQCTRCHAMTTLALTATHWLIFDTDVRNCSVLTVYTMFVALTKHTGLIMRNKPFQFVLPTTLTSMYQISMRLDLVELILAIAARSLLRRLRPVITAQV